MPANPAARRKSEQRDAGDADRPSPSSKKPTVRIDGQGYTMAASIKAATASNNATGIAILPVSF
jgi:hypothetical protein